MKPRLLSTPYLSVRERTLLFSLLVFTPEKAASLLERLSKPLSQKLRQELDEVAQTEPRVLILELRRLFDSRFEGIERVHSSWLLHPLEEESPSVQAAWSTQLPPKLRTNQSARPSLATIDVLQALLANDLVEMPPEPRGALLRWRHLADLSQEILENLSAQVGPEVLGKALSHLGEELAKKVAQRIERKEGLLLLEGYYAGGQARDRNTVIRALKRAGLRLEEKP